VAAIPLELRGCALATPSHGVVTLPGPLVLEPDALAVFAPHADQPTLPVMGRPDRPPEQPRRVRNRGPTAGAERIYESTATESGPVRLAASAGPS